MSDKPQFDHSKAQALIEQLNSGIRVLADQTNNRITNAKTMQEHWTGHHADQFFGTEVPRIQNQAHDLTTHMQRIINSVQAASDAAWAAEEPGRSKEKPQPLSPTPPPFPWKSKQTKRGAASAIPSELTNWAYWASGLNKSMDGMGQQVNQAIEDFNRAPQEPRFIGKVDQVGDDVIGYAVKNGVIDDWVGQVGRAFIKADHKGVPPQVYKGNREDFISGLNTASEADLAQLVGDDPVKQADDTANGAKLAAQLKEAEDANDTGRVHAILGQLQGQSQQFVDAFLNERGTADAQLVNDGLKLPPGKDGIQKVKDGAVTIAIINARLAAGDKLTDAERTYLDNWYNTVGADNLAKLPQYVRDAAPSMADHRRGPDGLPMETYDDAAARLTRDVVSPIADGIMNLSNPDKGGHDGLGQMPKAIQDLANTPIGHRDPDSGLLWPDKDYWHQMVSPVDGLGRFNGFADLMQASSINGGTQFTKEIGEQAIRVKQDLNAVAGNLSDALRYEGRSDQAYDTLRQQTSDAAVSHLLSVVGRNDAASSQLLLDQHDRQALLGMNWQDDHGAADVVRGGTNRDPKTGGGTMDQANAALAVMQELGGDRKDYLHRMPQGLKDAVVDTGINWMDTFGRDSVPGTPSRTDAHMIDIFGKDAGIGIQLSPDDRAHFLQFVSGTGDRNAMRFHAAAVYDSRALVADALRRGNSVDVNAALDFAGRLDGAITAADYQYALDQTGDKHDEAVAAAEAEKRRNWAYSLVGKLAVTGVAQTINVATDGAASPFTALGVAAVNPLIDKVLEAPPPPPDPTLHQREDLFNKDRLADAARRDYFLVSAANQAGVIPPGMQARADTLYVHDEHGQVVRGLDGQPVLKSYDELVKSSNLLQSQSEVADASFQEWSRTHKGNVDLQRYTQQRDGIANGSYWHGSPTNSPWHDDDGARVLLYGHNVSQDGKVDSLFAYRVPSNPDNYYVPPWKRAY